MAQGLRDGQGVGQRVVLLAPAWQPEQRGQLGADHLGRGEPEEAGEAGPDVDESVGVDGAGDAVEGAVLVKGGVIGAVRVDGGNAFAEVDLFKTYVRPVKNPVLSDYFVSLTGITQADVDRHGVSFPEALAAFSVFVGDDGAAVVSNGTDHAALDENCALHGIACPIDADRFVDIRPRLARLLGLTTPEVISAKLPSLLRLPGRRKEHDALADARAIAQALRHLRQTGRL